MSKNNLLHFSGNLEHSCQDSRTNFSSKPFKKRNLFSNFSFLDICFNQKCMFFTRNHTIFKFEEYISILESELQYLIEIKKDYLDFRKQISILVYGDRQYQPTVTLTLTLILTLTLTLTLTHPHPITVISKAQV